jgi:hypothetical protein
MMNERVYFAKIKSPITSAMDEIIHFLRSFSDSDGIEEVKREIKWLSENSTQSLIKNLNSLENLLNNPPKEKGDLAEIVAWEANWVLVDPSDEGAKKWLREVAELIRDALGDKAPPRPEETKG